MGGSPFNSKKQMRGDPYMKFSFIIFHKKKLSTTRLRASKYHKVEVAGVEPRSTASQYESFNLFYVYKYHIKKSHYEQFHSGIKLISGGGGS